jgi:glycosyltransferase involved in cell wall biosynthesis
MSFVPRRGPFRAPEQTGCEILDGHGARSGIGGASQAHDSQDKTMLAATSNSAGADAGLPLRKIAFVGDYVPRRCGIATFTHDVATALAQQFLATECFVVPVNDADSRYEYPPEVRFEFVEQDLDSYHRAADFLNFANVDVVCLQHEYGIFGGASGSHVLALLRDLHMPIVTTLHTVLKEPSREQQRVMKQLIELSARLIVMSEHGRQFLRDIHGAPEEKIHLIPHGIPDMPFVDPNFYKDQLGVEGRLVALTFGLLSPNKGIEYVLRALPHVVKEFPDLVYLVLGATHPALVRAEGETYRLSLQRLVQDLGIQRNVVFYDQFVELDELIEVLGAADLYITPYVNPAQVTSGTLAYAFGCGKAVISTPYWHAEELLADGRGLLVEFNNCDSIADAMLALIQDETRRHAMRKQAYLLGREMIWSKVAHQYMHAFVEARRGRCIRPRRLPRATLNERAMRPLKPKLDHLLRMTDTTGLLQHATHTVPNFNEGYSTDDNARALLLTVLLEDLGLDSPEIDRLASTYAAFLQFAFDPGTHRFRNILGYRRDWLDDHPSEDTLGRCIWALGTCVGRSRRRGLQHWAVRLFEQALPGCDSTTYARCWAFALLGIDEYLRRFSGDRLVDQYRDELTNRLIAQFERCASDDWPWFEDAVTYCNAKIPHALIVSGRSSGNERATAIGFRTLRWLTEVQRSAAGQFRPIGCNGFFPRGGVPADCDQQPVEAQATISACIEAYHTSHDEFWLKEARDVFAWFFGRNHLGQMVYDSTTGGCFDGVQQDRLNQNQGAESMLAFLLSQAEITLLENTLAAFQQPPERVAEPGLPAPENAPATIEHPHRVHYDARLAANNPTL